MSGYRGIFVFLLLSFLFSFPGNNLKSQTPLDSLLLIVRKSTDQQEQSKLYKKIADQFYEIHQDSTVKYYHKSLDAARLSPAYQDDIIILRSFAHLYGNRQNNYQEAKKYLQEAFAVAQTNSDDSQLALIKNDLGIMAQKAGDFQEAINCFFEAYRLIQLSPEDDVAMRILLSLGVIHNETSYHEKAINYYEQALIIAKRLDHQKIIGLLHNNLGKAYRDINDFTKSTDHLLTALATFDSLNNVYWKGLVLYNFGYNSFLQSNTTEAIRHYKNALELNKISKEKDREIMLITALAEVYASQQKHTLAIESAQQGLAKLKEINTTEYYSKLHEILGKCYQQTGDFKLSSYHLDQHIKYKEQRKEEDHSSKIGQLQAMHEAALQAEAVKQLKLKLLAEEVTQQKTRLFFRLLLISLSLAIALLGLLFYRYKLKETQKNYQLRNQLARDLHDNIGSSLNHIKIILNRFRRKVNTDQSEIKSIQTISDDIITNMYDLIWSLDKEKEKTDDLIEYMRDHASNVLSSMDIPLQIKVTNNDRSRSISAEIKNNIYSIYKEAINNIVKHTQPKFVNIQIKISDKHLNLLIENDTETIKKSQASAQLGLMSMKKRAQLIKGILDIHEQENKFRITLTVKLFS